MLFRSYEIFIDAINKMVDKSCDEETLNRMLFIISREEGVEHVDSLQTRIFGNKIYVDVEISVDDNLTLLEAHEISERVHLEIEKNFVLVKHCMVHVNPCSEKNHK